MKQSLTALMWRVRSLTSCNRGFSTLESLLALTLLAATFATSFQVMRNCLQGSIYHAQYTRASELAYEKIENIIADNDFLGYTYASNETNYPSEVVEDFSRGVDIFNVDPNNPDSPVGYDTGTKQVHVKVVWQHDPSVIWKYSTLIVNRPH